MAEITHARESQCLRIHEGQLTLGEMLQRRAKKMQIAPDPDPEDWGCKNCYCQAMNLNEKVNLN